MGQIHHAVDNSSLQSILAVLKEHDTIRLGADTFDSNILSTDHVTLTGEGTGAAAAAAATVVLPSLRITGNDCHVQNLQLSRPVTYSEGGISVTGARNKIDNIVLTGQPQYDGISL